MVIRPGHGVSPARRSRPALAAAADREDPPPSDSIARSRLWPELDAAGLVAVPGPLGAVLSLEQKNALRDVLAGMEQAGGKLYTGRPPRLTARDSDTMARQVEKNPAHFRASLWVAGAGKAPASKLESLADLQAAEALVTGHGAEALKNRPLAEALHRLDGLGWAFQKTSRSGGDAKQLGLLDVYRSLEEGHLYDALVVKDEHRVFHVSSADALTAIDFFFGSGDASAVPQPELAATLKKLAGLGFEPRRQRGSRRGSAHAELLDAYFSARSGNPIDLCHYGQVLVTGTAQDLEAAAQARLPDLERGRRVMEPLIELGVSYSGSQEDLYAELNQPVAGLELEERAEVAASLLRALPDKVPGTDEGISAASLVADLYRDCRRLGEDGPGLRRLAARFVKTLQSRDRKLFSKAHEVCGRYHNHQTLRAALLVGDHLDWLQRLAQAAEGSAGVSDASVDDLVAILPEGSQGVEAFAGLLDALPRTKKEGLSREGVQSARVVLEPLAGVGLLERVEAFRRLGLPALAEGHRAMVYGAFRDRVEAGQSCDQAVESVTGLLARATAAVGEKAPDLYRYVLTEAPCDAAGEAVLALAPCSDSPWEAVQFCRDRQPSLELARAAAPIFKHTGFSDEVADLLTAEPGCVAVLQRLAPLLKDGEVCVGVTRALGAFPPEEQGQALDFLDRLDAATDPKLPARALQGALEAVAARRAPGQSFADASAPLFDLIPALSRRVELATVLWDRVPPAEQSQGLEFLDRASKAALGELTDDELKQALETVLDLRTPAQSLEEASLPLIRLLRLMAEEPAQALETYRFVSGKPELLERFEHAYLKSWDAAAVRETLAMTLAHDERAPTIQQQGASVRVGSVVLPVKRS